MESDPLLMAIEALTVIADPMRLLLMATGVVMGLVLGIIPGIGGLLGLAILLPFTFSMDPYSAFAILLGLSAVTVTSDAIPAILFSVPGTVASAATVLDGFPMARQGQAGRALGAAFFASVVGGLFGAVVLGISIPILQPLVLLIGSPELLAICIFGLSLVASVSGRSALKGIGAATLGLLLAMVGEDTQTATLRWDFGTTYLWDGVPIVALALGLFALPEMADMAITRKSITADRNAGSGWAQFQGVRDVIRNWWLVIRCSSIGAFLGAVPGLGASVIDWVAYGHAARTEKGASESFGKGDVRGVIASESSNNAKEGGALVPTIAFGVPGSASMALLLSAFLIHGLVPGPEMLTTRLDVTYVLVWSVALANILGAGICFVFASQFAKIALIRIGILAPIVIGISFVGAFQASQNWGDLIAIFLFGVLGWTMKRVDWPRPPLILGFVLGALVERYMFISISVYEFEWLAFPIVIAFLALAALGLLRPVLVGWRRRARQTRRQLQIEIARTASVPELAFAIALLALFAASLAMSAQWPFGAKLVPQVIGWAGVGFVSMHLVTGFVRVDRPVADLGAQGASPHAGQNADIQTDFGDLSGRLIATRGAVFLGWCLFYLATTALIGLLPAMFAFLVGYMRIHARETWRISLGVAAATVGFCYLVFHVLVSVAWPQSLLGDLFPALRRIEAINLF